MDMRINPPLLVTCLLLNLTTLTAEATLTPYTSAGQSLVYSSVSDITWTGDANLLGSLITSQGYNNVVNAIIAASPVITDSPNYWDGSFGNYGSYSGQYTLSAADFSSSNLGRTTWFGAQAFTSYLNSINYAGSRLWALPSAGANPQVGDNQTGGQFGQLYYNELNKLAYPGSNGSDYGILGDGSSYTSGTAGPFSNAQTSIYWSGTEYAPDLIGAWIFYTSSGYQIGGTKITGFYAWAVSPGQVSAVPVPGATWLFGAGLVGLLGLKRCGHAG
jgi:hypothetical protein